MFKSILNTSSIILLFVVSALFTGSFVKPTVVEGAAGNCNSSCGTPAHCCGAYMCAGFRESCDDPICFPATNCGGGVYACGGCPDPGGGDDNPGGPGDGGGCTLTPPGEVRLRTPEHLTVFQDSSETANLTWTGMGNWGNICGRDPNNHYTVMVSQSCTGTYVSYGPISSQSWTLSNLRPGTQYCWYVRRSNGHTSVLSSTWRFTTANAPTVHNLGFNMADVCGTGYIGRAGMPNSTNPVNYQIRITDQNNTNFESFEGVFSLISRAESTNRAIFEPSIAHQRAHTSNSFVVGVRGVRGSSNLEVVFYDQNGNPYSDVGTSGDFSDPNGRATVLGIGTITNALWENNSSVVINFNVRIDNDFGGGITNPTNIFDAYAFSRVMYDGGVDFIGQDYFHRGPNNNTGFIRVDLNPPIAVISNASFLANGNFSYTYEGTDNVGIASLGSYITSSSPNPEIRSISDMRPIVLNSPPNEMPSTPNGISRTYNPSTTTSVSDGEILRDVSGNSEYLTTLELIDIACNVTRVNSSATTPQPWILTDSGNVSVGGSTMYGSVLSSITIPDISNLSIPGIIDFGTEGVYFSRYSVISGSTQSVASPSSSISRLNKYIQNYQNDAQRPPVGNSWYSYLLPLATANSGGVVDISGPAEFSSNLSSDLSVPVGSTTSVSIEGDLVVRNTAVCNITGVIFVSGNIVFDGQFTRSGENACIFISRGGIEIGRGLNGTSIPSNSPQSPHYDVIEAMLISDGSIEAVEDVEDTNSGNGTDDSWMNLPEPLALWTFDEGAPGITDVWDHSGNGRVGRWVNPNSVFWRNDILHHRGSIWTRMSYPGIHFGDLGISGDVSIEFWMHSSNENAGGMVLTQVGAGSGNDMSGSIRVASNGVYIRDRQAATWRNIIPTGSIELDRDYRIGIVFSGNTVTGYLNGVRQLTTPASGFEFNGQTAGIGVAGFGLGSMTMLLDNFVIYPGALSDAQMSFNPYYAHPDLIAAWSFDENTGVASADLTGNGHNGSFVRPASWNPWRRSLDRYSAFFNGVASGGNATYFEANDLNHTGDATVSFMIQPQVVNGSGIILGDRNSVNTGRIERINRNIRIYDGTQYVNIFPAGTLTATTYSWNSISLVFNGNVVTPYIGRVRYPDVTLASGFELDLAGFNISMGLGLNSAIDDMRIYNRALSENEVMMFTSSVSSSGNKGEGLYINGSVISGQNYVWGRNLNGEGNLLHPSVIINNDPIYYGLFNNILRNRIFSIRER